MMYELGEGRRISEGEYKIILLVRRITASGKVTISYQSGGDLTATLDNPDRVIVEKKSILN